MINTYSFPPNPCGFCSDNPKESPNEKKEDYLQIDLDGNDTTLFIRETSVEDVRSVQQDITQPVEEDIVREGPSSSAGISSFPEDSSYTQAKTERTLEEVNTDDKTARNKQFDSLYFKKWSGKTYFEEELRKIRIQEYQKDLEEAIKKRNLWKAFQKDMVRERRRDLIKTSGPEWWQEPSRKQICLATSLGDVITADYEEGVTGRTRQWLLDLGVTTRVTPKQVRACMKSSLLDPIDFLLETHSVILKSQLNIKKKRGDLERPFSVNERLLLTAVCVLHLPTLLTMLHYILPPPKPYSTVKHIQELLFGDLDDERVRYSTPYMEPIPFRNRSHFLNWAVDKVFRALLPSVVTTDILDEHKGGSLSFAIPSMRMSVMSQPPPTVTDKRRETSRYSDSSHAADSVAWLISQCIAKRQPTPSLFPFYDTDDGSPKFYSRNVTKRSILSKPFVKTSFEENVDDIQEDISPSVSANTAPGVKKISTGTFHKGIVNFSDVRSSQEIKPQLSHHFSYEGPTSEQFEVNEGLLPAASHHSQLSLQSQAKFAIDNINKSSRSNNREKVSESGEDESIIDVMEPENLVMRKLWDEIAALPKNQQLEHALGVLREMGDPLASLPKVQTIPTVLRWLEIRQGKNRILSKEAKAELLSRSRGMWKMAPVGNTLEGPKMKCSKRAERLLTWDKKKWLGTEVKKAIGKYYTTVKQEKVDNARTFFPTMMNHYDHGSKLNRNFRDVFFTYLPAREADTFVYRPWQPQETKQS